MKKIFTFSLMAALSMTLLSACGGSSKEDDMMDKAKEMRDDAESHRGDMEKKAHEMKEDVESRW